MPLAIQRSARLPLLIALSIASILASTVYINSRLVGNSSIGVSDSFDAFRSRTYNLRTQSENYNYNSIARPLHPISPFYQRGENFDWGVSRQRGVLVCMHDGVLDIGLSLIRELRCLGNQELVQVYHCGQEELSKRSMDLIFRLDKRVELVDVCSDLSTRGVVSPKMATKFRSWWIKPLAMYHTDVRHVMLLDVDDMIMKDPAVLRQLDGYVETGTTFFYDRVVRKKKFLNGNDGGKYYLRKLLRQFDYDRFNLSVGLAPSDHVTNTFAFKGKSCHEMDSSMVLIDKERAGQTVMDIMLWFITEERFRFKYSWGDKETFWLAFELAHVPYFFSPWGVSVVDSVPNEDMQRHSDTLCGSILQFVPVDNNETEVLYVNGKALIDPYPQGVAYIRKAKPNNLFNMLPTHMTPRQRRREVNLTTHPHEKFNIECLVGLGATPLPDSFSHNLLRRRLHFLGVAMDVIGSLQTCETYDQEEEEIFRV
ncbi:hypothetical protein PHYSODRAFT_499270 [Phytophthora sojae]|uniref:Uncharacterized protein n=1 Tax=Phytophthora sojae (strain P6497) TaxID=1094619 RepID=G4ZDT0_PHYSP|nr:hypothetical protein PHYSODRAFT_499270 [Phytophthora sojae]EGZ19009.1 hypothetical protein PHYSODRAFT_499270 [Phytophthora sojae]|eukprot:XP_009528067.1 hypothetical protein PHYSODRAFT_499270 [Phytophthora sojae]